MNNVIYLYSKYHGEVITPNLDNYQADIWRFHCQLLTNQNSYNIFNKEPYSNVLKQQNITV